ncbi:684_t:CDS:2 [Funneliformis caledonium]|uniref:684_t:CDS:1 n=1 Tax=Funneliformis caledonium TaxID=1117310 RepID=A0A9N8V3J7_9GLOM|nr:684_t:CDS:2 [Funneliformis caledonium]
MLQEPYTLSSNDLLGELADVAVARYIKGLVFIYGVIVAGG